MIELAPEDKDAIEDFTKGIRKCIDFPMPVQKAPELFGPVDGFKIMSKMLPYMGVVRKWGKVTLQDFAQRLKNPFLRHVFPFAPNLQNGPDFPILVFMMILAWMHQKVAAYPIGGSLELARAIERRARAATPALLGLRDKGQIQSGQKVLINGASGGVGTFAVQIAKSFGAEVTGVCSTRKMDMVRAIGADHIIDYTHEDFTKSGKSYDLILAAGGNHSIFDYKRALSPEGIYVCIGGSMSQYFQAMLLGPLISMVGRKKMGTVFAPPTQKDYDFLIELYEAGKVARARVRREIDDILFSISEK
jgi:hypothetical protein